MTTSQPINRAVVSTRAAHSRKSLNFFPTPPWVTRALAEIVLPELGLSLRGLRVWEPASGEGHMASVLDEYDLASLWCSDVHAYTHDHAGRPNHLNAVASFVGEGADVHPGRRDVDAIITNPPFKLAEQFILRAIAEAPIVAMLMRSAALEGAARYERIFKPYPPKAVAQFVERAPMHEGRWDPDGASLTAYAWFVWQRPSPSAWSDINTRLLWIPPGQRTRLTKQTDAQWFGGAAAPDALFTYKNAREETTK